MFGFLKTFLRVGMRLWVVIGQNAAHDLYSDLERGKLETKTPNNILHFSSWQLHLYF